MSLQTTRKPRRMNNLVKILALLAIAAVLMISFRNTNAEPLQGPYAATTTPSFEVASIKRTSKPIAINPNSKGEPGHYVASDSSLKMLIEFAFNVRDFQVSGGSGWIDTEKFDVDAKLDDSMIEEQRNLPFEQVLAQMRLAMRSLLADRFGLKVHRQKKNLEAFALVVSKGGPKLGTAVSQTTAPNRNQREGTVMISMVNAGHLTLTAKEASLDRLASMLSYQFDRPVINQSGIKGTYTFTLQWTPDAGTGLGGRPILPPPEPSQSPPDRSGASIFTAIHEQLGLKLESKRVPTDTIVVDRAHQPTPN
ncbi:MAG TPA: TIGR03435 family protein [Candidatus Acidoferrales bacterium]|nr:TIGR03435 family protein [Candidatus Acidoferrales bacterium]